MTASIRKDDVIAALTVEQVIAAYNLGGRWHGRWIRSKTCPTATHGTDAFGVSRDGKWHCHACNVGGGDLISMIAAFEQLDCRAQFGDVLEVAASLCGVEPSDDDWGESKPLRKPAPRPRADTQPPIADRVKLARRRAEWIWSHLKTSERTETSGRHWFLETRGLSWAKLPHHARVNVRDLGFWTVPGDYDELAKINGEADTQGVKFATASMRRTFNDQGVGIAVRHVDGGYLTDVRARKAEPAEGEPKIMGMLGGVTVDSRGGTTDLVACYGNPHALISSVVVVVEGWADYLTAAMRWPRADVLGAVDAGQYPLVAGFAARYVAEMGGRVVLVAQDDGAGGAAARAVEAASKRSIAIAGPSAVSWIEAADYWIKDLNDLAQANRLGELPDIEPKGMR